MRSQYCPCAPVLTRNLPPLVGGLERLVWHNASPTPYLQLMRKGTFYDCEPLQMRQPECNVARTDSEYRAHVL